MIVDQFYLSDEQNINKVMEMTGLAQDELSSIVGHFKRDHWRFAGKMRGEVVVYASGKIVIRHHFTKKRLFVGE